MLKLEEFKTMMNKQYELNEHFNGKNWEDKLKIEDIKIAILTEFAEFMEETPKWKWWKQYKMKTIDKRKQYEELIDILHFAMTLMMKQAPRENLFEIMSDIRQIDIKKDYLFYKTDLEWDVTDFVYEFLKSPFPENYLVMIEALIDYAQLDGSKLFDVYLQKNEKNHKRIEAGYTKGDETIKQVEEYVKID